MNEEQELNAVKAELLKLRSKKRLTRHDKSRVIYLGRRLGELEIIVAFQRNREPGL